MRIFMQLILLVPLLLTGCEMLDLPTGSNEAAFAVY